MAVLVAGLLTACASPITAKVTSFNQWPGDVAGSTFSYIRPTDGINDLEQQAYEGYVQIELERLGLKRAPAGQVGRIEVDIVTGNGTKDRKVREAVYQDSYIFYPPYRNAAGNVYPGYWGPDRFGSRYVGDREVIRTMQVSNLRIRLLDSKGNRVQCLNHARCMKATTRICPIWCPILCAPFLTVSPGRTGVSSL
jgi:hypothetical protein